MGVTLCAELVIDTGNAVSYHIATFVTSDVVFFEA
jgi:hypothetical protein